MEFVDGPNVRLLTNCTSRKSHVRSFHDARRRNREQPDQFDSDCKAALQKKRARSATKNRNLNLSALCTLSILHKRKFSYLRRHKKSETDHFDCRKSIGTTPRNLTVCTTLCKILRSRQKIESQLLNESHTYDEANQVSIDGLEIKTILHALPKKMDTVNNAVAEVDKHLNKSTIWKCHCAH